MLLSRMTNQTHNQEDARMTTADLSETTEEQITEDVRGAEQTEERKEALAAALAEQGNSRDPEAILETRTTAFWTALHELFQEHGFQIVPAMSTKRVGETGDEVLVRATWGVRATSE